MSPALAKYFESKSTGAIVPRLAISVEAMDKCGKTHWALHTAPDPICIISNDPGTEAIVHKARAAGKVIYHRHMEVPTPPPESKARTTINQTSWDEWKKSWEMVKEIEAAVIADTSIRTYVTDTETEKWHLAELAYFGKLQGNQNQDVRTKLNADYCQTFWRMYNTRRDLNMILIHKQGKEYKKGADGKADWSGGYEIKGYSGIGFMVDASLRLGWNPTLKSFYVEVPSHKTIRYGDPFTLSGKQWWSNNGDYGFGYVAMEMWPETEERPEVWGLI
jgi:hypothetical protein